MHLNFIVKAEQARVFACLTDTDKFVAAHPLIYRMDSIGQHTYKVYEKVKLGFIPHSFTYTAMVNGNEAGDQVRIEAHISGMTHIVMNFQLTPTEEGTRISEDITISTRLPIIGFLQKMFRKQHTILFENIGRLSSPGNEMDPLNPAL